MAHHVLALLIWAAALQSPTPELVASTLSRAQALYYDASFQETIELLLPLDRALRSEDKRTKEKIDIKLQIALAHVGLGQMPEATRRFGEICALDPDYSLDPKKFAPKVVSAFEEAKEENEKVQCRMLCAEADKLLDAGNAEALLALVNQTRSRCNCIEASALDAAEHFYDLGVEAYRKEMLSPALEYFQAATQFNPDHTLARSYIDLTRNRLQLAAEQMFLKWRREFDGGNFGLAASTYRALNSANIEGSANEAIEKVRAGYRGKLSPVINSWKLACSKGDSFGMAQLHRQAEEMLPDPGIGRDLMADMDGECTKQDCIQLSQATALGRVEHREDAKLPPGIVPRPIPQNFALTIPVRVRIDEIGSVTVADPESIQSNIRDSVVAAAGKWKFNPYTSGTTARCVGTTIPIAFRP
jgi:tetratricopeptide (TPR) repeat protein